MRHFFFIPAFLTLWCTGSSLSFASEVVKVGSNQKLISVSQDSVSPWRMGDRICVQQNGAPVACGKVVKPTEAIAIVELDNVSYEIGRGDRVGREAFKKQAAIPTPRKPAATEPVTNLRADRDVQRLTFHCISGGFSVGDGFYFPLVHFQRLIDSQWSLGILPTYFNTSSSIGAFSGFGVLGSVNYYGRGFFEGLWGQLATGAYFFSSSQGTTQEEQTSLSVLGTIGWRAHWDLGLNIGVGLGAQYIKDPAFTTVNLGHSEIRILALFDVGIPF